MKAIKIAVVIMSVLLVVGFGVVIYTISTRVSDGTLTQNSEQSSEQSYEVPSKVSDDDNSAAEVEEKLSGPFGTLPITIPFGCQLVDAQLRSDKILLRFEGDVERGCQKIELYSSVNGKHLGGWIVEGTGDNPE